MLADNSVADASTDTRDQWWRRNAGDARLQDVIRIVVVVPLTGGRRRVAAVKRIIGKHDAVAIDLLFDIGCDCARGRAFRSAPRERGRERQQERKEGRQQPNKGATSHAGFVPWIGGQGNETTSADWPFAPARTAAILEKPPAKQSVPSGARTFCRYVP